MPYATHLNWTQDHTEYRIMILPIQSRYTWGSNSGNELNEIRHFCSAYRLLFIKEALNRLFLGHLILIFSPPLWRAYFWKFFCWKIFSSFSEIAESFESLKTEFFHHFEQFLKLLSSALRFNRLSMILFDTISFPVTSSMINLKDESVNNQTKSLMAS